MSAALWAVPLLALATGAVLIAGPTDQPPLRVCADPNNLPYSNEAGEGFENALAEIVADEMGRKVVYTWHPQRRGFVRNTLQAGECDVVMGVPGTYELALTTEPYYRSTYVFVTRADRALEIASLDDPRLRDLRIGVHVVGDDYSSTPGATALARRGIIDGIVGYSIFGNYDEPHPPSRLIEAVAAGDVDMAIAWGPIAGYFAALQPVELSLVPVSPQIDPPFTPFVFDMAMAVRRGDDTLRVRLEEVLQARRPDIERVLREYSVPQLPFGRGERVGRTGGG